MAGPVVAQLSKISTDPGGATQTTPGITTSASGSTFVVFAFSSNVDFVTGVSDNKGNTYTLVDAAGPGSNGEYCACYICPNGNGGAGHTASSTWSFRTTLGMFFIEVTGAALSSVVDAHAIINDTSQPWVQAVTTTGADKLILSCCGSDASGVATWAVSGGTFSLLDSTSGNTACGAVASMAAATTGTYTPSFTDASGAFRAVVSTIALNAASGGGSSTPYPVANAQRNRRSSGRYL